jgi:hypothetical protein
MDTGCLMLEKIGIFTFKSQIPPPPRLKAKPTRLPCKARRLAKHREASRHERAGGGRLETSTQHLPHKGNTMYYQCFLPQNSKKSQLRA